MNAARRPIIIGNWKMHKTAQEARDFAAVLRQIPWNSVDVGVAPPYTALAAAVEALQGSGVGVYAQNVHWDDKGAFTGEISGGMLRDIGVDGAIIGHSERRRYFGETDETVAKRLRAALRHQLKPVVCVGETLDERKSGQTLEVIRRQIVGALEGLSPADAVKVVVAYEPVWAIGTGETATPEQAQEVHEFIRKRLGELFGPDGAKFIRIQYGGSVTPENAGTLLGQADVDGALVGGASLVAENFAKIINFR
jgi:triosephosphate isomerase